MAGQLKRPVFHHAEFCSDRTHDSVDQIPPVRNNQTDGSTPLAENCLLSIYHDPHILHHPARHRISFRPVYIFLESNQIDDALG